jgi:predicted DNA-binding transcriptional regulator YafY
MNSRRLARLMDIICDIKAHPRRSPEEMCARLQISRRQFYKDRDTLLAMGFGFHYSRGRGGFVLDKELTFNVQGMSLAELFALILAVRELTRLSDYSLAMGALAGLRTLVRQLPPGVRPWFNQAVDGVVVADGFGCDAHGRAGLEEAIREEWRVVLVLEQGQGERRMSVAPRELYLREGSLFLEASGDELGEGGLVALSRVRRVISTPIFTSRRGSKGPGGSASQ